MSAGARIWLCAAAYGLVYFGLGADRYLTYHSGADLGLFTQSIASAFGGFHNTLEGANHFTYHFSPILFLCTPLLLAVHSPLALVAVQALAGALTAPALFFIARRRTDDGVAFAIATIPLLYPPLAGVTFTDFHEDGFAPAATLWLVWAVDGRKWVWAIVFVLLTLGIKEDQGLILAVCGVFGAVYFARRREWPGIVFCASATVLALATFASYFAFVRPLAGAVSGWSPQHFYAWQRGNTPGSAPWYFIGRPAYVVEALLPLLFLSVASPLFLTALPGFAEVLGSHDTLPFTMGQHYAGVWIGWVLAAFALAVANIARRSPGRAHTLVRICLVLCVLNLALASPTHWGHFLRLRSSHDAALDRMLARLPPDAEVGTHDELYAHLGFDPNASIGLLRRPAYLVFDRSYSSPTWVAKIRPLFERELGRGAYRLEAQDDGVDLYARTTR